MRVADVNILVYAHREEMPRHRELNAWLSEAAVGPVGLGLTTIVTAGFVRIVTNHRILSRPSTTDEALAFLDTLRLGPAVRLVEPGGRHWSIFGDLCRRADATGNLVPDAALAAIAIEHGATLITTDRDFARFPGLHWQHPLDG
jgi:toxin-antitoxin system PIN domain toxin